MSIDKSLRRKNNLQRARNVLTRGERIVKLQAEERWPDGRSPYGLPKVKVIKVVVKKAKKKEEKVEGAEGEAAAAGRGLPAAPAAGGRCEKITTCNTNLRRASLSEPAPERLGFAFRSQGRADPQGTFRIALRINIAAVAIAPRPERRRHQPLHGT